MIVWLVYNLTTEQFVTRPNGEPYASFKKSNAIKYMWRTLKKSPDRTELQVKGFGFDETA